MNGAAMRRIREAIEKGTLVQPFRPSAVNRAFDIDYPVTHLVLPPSWQLHTNLLHPPLALRSSAESRPLEAPNFGLVLAENTGLFDRASMSKDAVILIQHECTGDGSCDFILTPSEIAFLLRVPASWVYQHKTVLPLFQHRALRASPLWRVPYVPAYPWGLDIMMASSLKFPDFTGTSPDVKPRRVFVRERYQDVKVNDFRDKWRIDYWDYTTTPRTKRGKEVVKAVRAIQERCPEACG